jgi:hypothetical protein
MENNGAWKMPRGGDIQINMKGWIVSATSMPIGPYSIEASQINDS